MRSKTADIAAVALVVGSPAIAHASDMGLVVPLMFIPVELIAALLFLGIGVAGRTGHTGSGTRLLLRILGLLVGIPAGLMAFVALQYLVEGHYVETAAFCAGAFAVTAVTYGFAIRATRARRA